MHFLDIYFRGGSKFPATSQISILDISWVTDLLASFEKIVLL